MSERVLRRSQPRGWGLSRPRPSPQGGTPPKEGFEQKTPCTENTENYEKTAPPHVQADTSGFRGPQVGMNRAFAETLKQELADKDLRQEAVKLREIRRSPRPGIGAIVINRGTKRPGEKTLKKKEKRVTVSLTRQVFELLEIIEQNMGTSKSEIVNMAVFLTFGRHVEWE